MSAAEIMQQIEALPAKEQQAIFVLLTPKVVGARGAAEKPWRPLRPKTYFTMPAGIGLMLPQVMRFTWLNRRRSLMETSARPWLPRWSSGAERCLCAAIGWGALFCND